jgi:DNA (cytosine-5)-methyltransferase 1
MITFAYAMVIYGISIMSLSVSISEAAHTLGVSIDTIRRWEKKGLIKGHRNSRNVRIFDRNELDRAHVKFIGGEHENNYKILHSDAPQVVKSIELFAGAGGLALGLENAGIQHSLLVEIDKHAANTLKKNRPNWNVLTENAANIDYTPYRGKVDLVTGGFPCQSFSYAGKQLGFEDARGTLFFELARCIKETQPKIAIGENVKGLVSHDNGRTLKSMLTILDELGYNVAYKVLRSQYLDVPQKRERLVIVAVRKDLNLPIFFPKERDYTISLKEALKDVPESPYQSYSPRKKEILDMVPPGGYWRDLPDEIQKEYLAGSYHLGGGKTGMARRLSWDEPSLTLTCSPAQKQTERCHPSETRPLSVREYARIQTFPDDWIFEGSVGAQYKQIGNAVPVNLGYHIGRCIFAMLSNTKEDDMITLSDHQVEVVKQQRLFI